MYTEAVAIYPGPLQSVEPTQLLETLVKTHKDQDRRSGGRQWWQNLCLTGVPKVKTTESKPDCVLRGFRQLKPEELFTEGTRE